MTIPEMTLEIESFMLTRGGEPPDYYIGITKDIHSRLHGDHRVPATDDIWIYVDGNSDSDARTVEAHFLAKGCAGGPGGGDRESRFVYAYKRTPQTAP